MSIGTPNGILDITGATLRVSKMEFRQSTGFDTVLNNVARNTMLLMDETEQTTSKNWALKLPNAWVAEFHGYWASGSSGAPILFNFYNDSTSGTNGYTLSMDDTTISINYDGGSALGSATLSSTLNTDAYRKVAVIFERSVLDVSVDGEHVFHFADSQLRDRVYDDNSGYVTFTHSSTDERKLKNLKFTNGDKWVREIDSSNIAYVGGNVGIGTTIPGTKFDVSGTVRGTHLIGDGSAISAIQSSNVSDFASNVTRIGTLETNFSIVSSNLSDNSSRITALESGDISISGDKTFTGDVIFESNVHMNSGNVFVANTVNLTVSDPIIELGSNNLNMGDLGIIMTRHGATNSNVAVVYDEDVDILRMGYTLNGANDTVVDLDSNALAVSVQGALSAASITTDDYLIHDGDTDTKVGFPSADTFTVSTAGSERLRVDSSGNVGIGTATVDAPLHIFKTAATASDIGAGIQLERWDNYGCAIWSQYHGSVDCMNFRAVSAATDAYGGTPQMVLTHQGRIGIGTTSPDQKLHIEDSTNPRILIENTDGVLSLNQDIGSIIFKQNDNSLTGTGTIGKIRMSSVPANDGGNFYGESADMIFSVGKFANDNANIDALTIEHDGHIGIGTTSPASNLHVVGAASATHASIGTTAYPTLGGNWLTIFSQTFDGDLGPNHPDPDGGILFTNRSSNGSLPWGYYMGVVKDVASTTGTTQRFDIGKSHDLNSQNSSGHADTLTPYFTIDNGYVGIGTTSPGHILHVEGSAAGSPIHKRAGAAATNTYNFVLNGPRPGTTTGGVVHFINGSTRTSDGGVDCYTIRNDSGPLLLGHGSYNTSLWGPVGVNVTGGSYQFRVNGTSNFNAEMTWSLGSVVSHAGWGSNYDWYIRSGSTSGQVILQDTGGYIGMGTSSPTYKLHVSDGNNSVAIFGPNSSWSSYLVVGAGDDKTAANNTAIAQCISTNGNLHLDAGDTRDIYMNHYSGYYIRHAGLGLASDDRLKSEEELITNATDTLLKLSPQKYLKKRTLREDEHREPVIETGLIAQDIWYDAPELRHIVLLGADADPTENKPEAPVDGDIQQDPNYSSWGPNEASVNYDGLIAYLVKSNQELHGEIQALKARITTLENA